MIPNFIAILEASCENGTERRSGISVRFTLGPTDRPKRSAWAELENDRMVGQISVWTSGECDIEVDSVADGEPVLRKTRTVETEEEFRSLIEEAFAAFT